MDKGSSAGRAARSVGSVVRGAFRQYRGQRDTIVTGSIVPADAAKHRPKIINFVSQSKNPQIEGLKKIRAHSGAVTDARWDAHSRSSVDISIWVLIILFYTTPRPTKVAMMSSRSDIQTVCGLWIVIMFFFTLASNFKVNNISWILSLCSHRVIFYLQPRAEHL